MAQTPATYILMYCDPQRLFLLYVASNSGKGYWDCKLPCIEAQIELFSSNEHERQLCEEFAPQPGATNGNDAHVCEPICINMYCRAKRNNQEKTTHSLKEGVTKIKFGVVNLFTSSICAIIYFVLWCNSVHRHGDHCLSFPLGEVRILCRTATRAHFVVINKGAGQFYLSFDTR